MLRQKLKYISKMAPCTEFSVVESGYWLFGEFISWPPEKSSNKVVAC